MYKLKVEQLSNEDFSPFGTYFNPKDCGKELGEKQNEPIKFYPDRMIALFEHSNFASISPLIIEPREFKINVTERHLHTEEVIGGFNNDTIFHVAKESGMEPNLKEFKAFYLPAGWWVKIKKGVWHQAPFTVGNQETVGIVILPPATYSNDCYVVHLKTVLEIEVV